MNTEENGTLDTLVQDKIEADMDFQDSLVDLTDDEQEDAIAEKTTEVRNETFKSLTERSDKNKELAGNYKTRAEKAEKKPAEVKKEEPTEPASNFNLKDATALLKAEITEDEDMALIERYVKLEDVSISEALKDTTLKAILANKAEERATAQATSTKNKRTGVKATSGAELTKNLSEGKTPDKGSKEAEDLFWERRGGRRD